MNKADIGILIVLALTILSCYHRGFIRTFFNMVAMIVTGIITYYLYPYITKFIITKTGIFESISEFIDENFNFDKLLSNLDGKEEQLDALNDLDLPDNITNMLEANNNPEIFDILDVSNFRDYVSSSLATIVLNVIVFIILFMIIYVLLSVVVNMLDLIAKLPILKQVNKLAGLALGVVMGIFIVYLGMLVVSLLISMNVTPDLVDLIEESVIAKVFYGNNPLDGFLSNNPSTSHFWQTLSKG